MMFRAFSALFLVAVLVTLGRAENYECRSQLETSNNHAEVMLLVQGLTEKFTHLQSSVKTTQEAVSLIQSSCNQMMKDSPQMDQLRKAECDPAQQTFENSCYFFSSGKADWVTAQDKCLGMGGSLIKISNDNEFNFIKDQMKENLWVGFSDQDSEGQFKWIADGSIFPLSSPWWHRGEPNNKHGNEHCGEFYWMHDTYMLNDNVCTGWELPYICEMKLL